jgi:hypothetical protein
MKSASCVVRAYDLDLGNVKHRMNGVRLGICKVFGYV